MSSDSFPDQYVPYGEPSARASRRAFLRRILAGAAVSFIDRSRPTGAAIEGGSLDEAARLIRTRAVSSIELTSGCLSKIERLNPRLNAFVTVRGAAAMADARALEIELANGGWRGPLHGIPVALKDNIDTSGVRTTAASRVFADRVPAEDAEVVRRLKAAGAIVLGKLNMHEFAHGTTSAISSFGAVRNPWNLDHIAGGSSGGAAAAVAAGLCYCGIGTDTGASIRLPAACCGIVGLKSTYGLVSARGVIPDSWSFDHVGPLCRTVADTAVVLSVIAGYDPQYFASIDRPGEDYTVAMRLNTGAFRLGVPRTLFSQKLDPEVEAAFDEALRVLRGLTAGHQDVELPDTPDLFAAVADAEAYAFHSSYLHRSPELYNSETRRQLTFGAKVTMIEYMQGRRDLDLARRKIAALFTSVDLLVLPTAPRPALTVAECRDAFAMPAFTGEFNIFGLPAISVPCGLTKPGLPIGLQIVGPRLGEAAVLALASQYERSTDWHAMRAKHAA